MRPDATIYLVTNLATGDAYVGITRFTLERRWAQHVQKARNPSRTYLHRAIRKYGAESFWIEAIASCLTREHAGEVERAIIQALRPVYNQTNGGEVTVGRRGGPELYARIAAANTGKKRTPEQIEANRAKAKARWASNPEYRAIVIEAASRGRARVDESKRLAAVSKSSRDRVWTEASRKKLSESRRGIRHTQEVIDRIGLKHRKPVHCVALNMVFGSCEEAAARLGFSRSSIYKVCAGARPSVGGLVFSYGELQCR